MLAEIRLLARLRVCGWRLVWKLVGLNGAHGLTASLDPGWGDDAVTPERRWTVNER